MQGVQSSILHGFLLDGTCDKVLTVFTSHLCKDMTQIAKFRFHAVIRYAMFAMVTAVATAKILPPRPVAPVINNGVRYSADRDGRDQYVVATDISTGKELWKVKVFHTRIKFWVEEDVQWVFITDLRLMDTSLFVRDGKARCYSVDVSSHRVRKVSCGTVFTQQEGPRSSAVANPGRVTVATSITRTDPLTSSQKRLTPPPPRLLLGGATKLPSGCSPAVDQRLSTAYFFRLRLSGKLVWLATRSRRLGPQSLRACIDPLQEVFAFLTFCKIGFQLPRQAIFSSHSQGDSVD